MGYEASSPTLWPCPTRRIGVPLPVWTHSPQTAMAARTPELWILHRWIHISEQLALQMQIYARQEMYVDQREPSMTEC
jgi:hypothetical protein